MKRLLFSALIAVAITLLTVVLLKTWNPTYLGITAEHSHDKVVALLANNIGIKTPIVVNADELLNTAAVWADNQNNGTVMLSKQFRSLKDMPELQNSMLAHELAHIRQNQEVGIFNHYATPKTGIAVFFFTVLIISLANSGWKWYAATFSTLATSVVWCVRYGMPIDDVNYRILCVALLVAVVWLLQSVIYKLVGNGKTAIGYAPLRMAFCVTVSFILWSQLRDIGSEQYKTIEADADLISACVTSPSATKAVLAKLEARERNNYHDGIYHPNIRDRIAAIEKVEQSGQMQEVCRKRLAST